MLKVNQDVAKEEKATFDRWMKLRAASNKTQVDAIAKAKKRNLRPRMPCSKARMTSSTP